MKNILLILAALAAFSAASAEPVTLTREQAFRLHSALEAIAPGLSPANTITAADNLNILAPTADAVRKGSVAMQRLQARLPEAPDRQERAMKLAEEFDAKADESAPYDLTPMEITADEIREAKIPPAVLAVIRRHLKPAKK